MRKYGGLPARTVPLQPGHASVLISQCSEVCMDLVTQVDFLFIQSSGSLRSRSSTTFCLSGHRAPHPHLQGLRQQKPRWSPSPLPSPL
jgi:hypothetical protein